jgi:hypothetical protein
VASDEAQHIMQVVAQVPVDRFGGAVDGLGLAARVGDLAL